MGVLHHQASILDGGQRSPAGLGIRKCLGWQFFLVFAELLFVDDDELLFGCFLCCCQGGALLYRLPLQVVSGRICRDRPGCVKEKNRREIGKDEKVRKKVSHTTCQMKRKLGMTICCRRKRARTPEPGTSLCGPNGLG